MESKTCNLCLLFIVFLLHPRPAQQSVCLFPFPFPFPHPYPLFPFQFHFSVLFIALDRINASVCPQFVLIDCLKSAAVYPQIDFIIMHSFRPPYIWTEIVHMCRASRSFSLSNGRHFDWETDNRTETLRLSRVRSRFSTVRGIQLLVDPNGNWTCKRQNSCRH